jgi:hypothetical protein
LASRDRARDGSLSPFLVLHLRSEREERERERKINVTCGLKKLKNVETPNKKISKKSCPQLNTFAHKQTHNIHYE